MRGLLGLGIASLAVLAASGTASAAIVANGDFETGTLSGWQSDNSPPSTVDRWYAYTGTTGPAGFMNPVPAPPQGTYAAITDQGGPGSHVLYQDVSIPSDGQQYLLSLLAYYKVFAPIASPDSLSSAVTPNEQYRIDVMKPTAPLRSVSSSDILLSVFRTVAGDPTTLTATEKTADLTPFAGQTVRLRFAEVDNQDVFNAGVDAVSVEPVTLALGQPIRNKKKGTAELPVTVSEPGNVTLTGTGVVQRLSAPASSSVAVGAGTTVNLVVKATGKKKRKLNNKGKAKVNVTVTYTPTGLSPESHQAKVKLKKKKKG